MFYVVMALVTYLPAGVLVALVLDEAGVPIIFIALLNYCLAAALLGPALAYYFSKQTVPDSTDDERS